MLNKTRLDFKNLKKLYPDEWMLIENFRTDKYQRLISGKVVSHSKNRNELYELAIKRNKGFAIRYTGEIPKDLVVILYVNYKI